MNYAFNREWLTKKFEEIRSRIMKGIDQLSDDQLNYSPDEYSNNIPTLLRHIEGNIKERISRGISKNEIVRDRDKEFSRAFMTKTEAELITTNTFQLAIELIKSLPDEKFEETQIVRGKERTNLDVLHQCAAHYSEHMGQILYIVKQILKEKYKSTSV